MSRRGEFAACVVALALIGQPIEAQTELRWSGAFDRAEAAPRPSLVIDAAYLTVTIAGHEGDSIHLTVRTARDGVPPLTPELRGATLRIVEPGNSFATWIEATVPRDIDVRVRSANQGAVMIDGVHGTIEVENSNAPIYISHARGLAVAATSNAEIRVSFDAWPDAGRLSLFTSNAPITVELPDGAGARVALETDLRVESDFPIVGSDGEIEDGAKRGRGLEGIIGGGGAMLRARTDNGLIRILRSAASSLQ